MDEYLKSLRSVLKMLKTSNNMLVSLNEYYGSIDEELSEWISKSCAKLASITHKGEKIVNKVDFELHEKTKDTPIEEEVSDEEIKELKEKYEVKPPTVDRCMYCGKPFDFKSSVYACEECKKKETPIMKYHRLTMESSIYGMTISDVMRQYKHIPKEELDEFKRTASVGMKPPAYDIPEFLKPFVIKK